MPKKLISLFRTATFRQTTLTAISTALNALLGAAFYFLLARWLGSSQYGAFSLIASAITLVAGVADLGTDQGLVRFVSSNYSDPKHWYPFAKTALILKSLSSGLVVIISLFFPFPISLLVAAGTAAQLFFSFSTSLSQARQKYWLWSGLLVGTNALRLFLVSLLYLFQTISVASVSLIYALLPLSGFLLVVFTLAKGFWSVVPTRDTWRQLFMYNRWVLGFVIVSVITSKLDLFLTASYLSISQTGIYALSGQLASVLPQLTSALGAVTAPKFSAFSRLEQNRRYLGKTMIFSLIISLLATTTLFVAAIFIIKFTGQDFSAAWTPFIVQVVALDIFLIFAPMRDSLLYYYSRPQFIFFASIGQLLLLVALSRFLILNYSLLGSSLLVLATQVFLALASTGYYLYLRHHE